MAGGKYGVDEHDDDLKDGFGDYYDYDDCAESCWGGNDVEVECSP